MRVLGINAIFDDPVAARVVDGTVAAADEERFGRRRHGRRPVPCSEDRDAAYRLGARAREVTKERFGLDRFRAHRDRLMEEETCASR
ncbi:hypothetical protein EV384_2988 [Micromonospora kangleipakensis]|uniref:Uncharacterized protein n=1 Tax=Micromonospora kangleipakensis TaxID=1077942 RepID=A0A4Q8B9T3_9ACTN|nr:hypothetical protein [Micromonospora kangleipakensis]RZU74517.1 hypothetical protein EV384_2988 [Micromonospora kangleipakensis]